MRSIKRFTVLALLILSDVPSDPDTRKNRCGTIRSNFYEPQILFANPAGISFREHRFVLFSSQFMFTGVTDNNLHNYFWGYIEPVSPYGVLGFRSSHFVSQLLKQNTFALLYGRSFFASRLESRNEYQSAPPGL